VLRITEDGIITVLRQHQRICLHKLRYIQQQYPGLNQVKSQYRVLTGYINMTGPLTLCNYMGRHSYVFSYPLVC
jgi:hypothetical protein